MINDVQETFPDDAYCPPIDRLMSSVMVLTQNALDRVEQFRMAIEQMLAHEEIGGDGWSLGWEMLKAVYVEEDIIDSSSTSLSTIKLSSLIIKAREAAGISRTPGPPP